jgi:hypothetical protein
MGGLSAWLYDRSRLRKGHGNVERDLTGRKILDEWTILVKVPRGVTTHLFPKPSGCGIEALMIKHFRRMDYQYFLDRRRR